MSARRRRRTRDTGGKGGEARTGDRSQGGDRRSRGKGGGDRSSKGSSKKGRRSRGRARRDRDGAGFWGDPKKLPDPSTDVRMTDDPAAVARSLGPPPLPGHEAIAEHYFAAVYDRAVTVAGALAAAGGLIEPEQLVDEPEEGGNGA